MDKYVSADTIWVLIGAFLVFSMQPGFAMVETGFTRAKNAGNIVMKNVMDMCLGSIVFWVLGFGLMFGTDIGGFIGTPDFFVKGDYGASYPSTAYFIFQTMFCATAATIVSGAMAERTNFLVYCIYSVLISAIIYPISGHWIWGGGWLAQMGFHDFAGSTAVHMVGGVASFVGAKMIGARIGKYNADGTVIEVTLNTVKVRNFDNTIITIPPYALVSDSFQNWRGMRESGGRRVKRSVNLDVNSVCFCTPEMLERYKKIVILKEYIEQTEQKVQQYNQQQGIDDSVPVNGIHQTNLGVFRAYLELYLKNLPVVNSDLTYMVRQLQPTEKGIPLEVYFFSREKDWVPYEKIQADVFDHIFAVVPYFGLKVFQNPSSADIVRVLERV